MTLLRKRLPWREPADVAAVLACLYGEEGLIWLDGDGGELGGRITLAADPLEQHCCRGLPGDPEATNPFSALRELSPGHWTGWLSYDAAAWTEPGNPWSRDPMASLWIARHDPVLRFDLQARALHLEGIDPSRHAAMAHLLETQPIKTTPSDASAKQPLGCRWHRHSDRDAFKAGVLRIRELIASGDLFQANLTACASATLPEPMGNLALYQRLRDRCPAPFSGVLIGSGAAAGEAVLSTSPERFLEVMPDGAVQTRPIKGTRPRHPDPHIDDDLAAELVCSAKDRAENVMIVDLLRNDLGRVCVPGSVQVPDLVRLESYARVHHLTSVVTGQLRAGSTWVDLLEASWPGGSITGAPKLRACQRLQELEPLGRGPYCGSILHIDWDGRFDSNILIRTLLRKNADLRLHAGCGIVADSDPEAEAEELDWKLLPLLEALA
ncbi:anthranilate synthase component I family protein [Synechococcus sp. CS-197]|uniref:anthranilate synthase component I family protein n=1 Tax=Synechococcus sp. CS-197 TaxID=2847985 RepID=UPI0001525CEB|nr:anthranilate synthase component I family protein [Synechococcus sp. CS-197]MCT0251053.1 anthranilate synthase component I family protein [Synechococcus sp. CS-197]CAK24896.1 Para-aminobenzoate synthase component I [Synechococcus sp. WH 7803]